MGTIIDAVMNYLNNHFHQKAANGNAIVERGTFAIADNTVTPISGAYKTGQYIRVIGSVLNDGVYQVDSTNEGTINVNGELANETFDGAIIPLAVPRAFVDLVQEVEQFQAGVADDAKPGIASESFNGYSYAKATGANGMPASWIEVFDTRLRRYRRMFPEVV